MEFRLHVIMVDPAGNRTAIVRDPVDPKYYAPIGAALLRIPELHAEQAGFLVKPVMGGEIRLEMSGGEFCGNATRSVGYLQASREGCRAGDLIPTEISGSPDVLNVRIDDDGAWCSMPLPLSVERLPVENPDYDPLHPESKTVLHVPLIVLDGISHAILYKTQCSETLGNAVIDAIRDNTGAAAGGAIFLDDEKHTMTPFVWVRSTGSRVWESSCGSGTLASAVWLSRGISDGLYRLELRQPGGNLHAEVEKKNGNIVCGRIGGPITIEEEKVFTVATPEN
ncbi:MAG: hypothetical protein PUB12_09300 [[Clostridium] aminophilum]|uniref:hypothetical protein n=1 Tax=[Clostridium] aminophilum TaxID=1526 RepID=UPI0026F13F68|nr:hypothetical protein [[Clostridium] aminophilum]MDD6197061.1 hypothetical protein [[Clostridium] aminophilum]